MTKIVTNDLCKCSKVEEENNILLKINQMKQELNDVISYQNGNICSDEVVRISRLLDRLIIDYEDIRFSNRR